MISALIAWGIGWGGLKYLPGHGLLTPPPPESAHNIFGVDQDGGNAGVFRGTTGGSADIFRVDQSGSTGKIFR